LTYHLNRPEASKHTIKAIGIEQLRWVRVRCMSHLVAIGECGWSAGANGQVFAVSLALPEDVITSWARKQVSAALTEAATSTWYAALPPKEEDEWTSRGRGQVLARHGSFAGGFGVTSPNPMPPPGLLAAVSSQ
jgi:hypothetical protein